MEKDMARSVLDLLRDDPNVSPAFAAMLPRDPITPLDLAWEQINALGGVPTNEIEEAQCHTINQCLDIIEKLGGSDPIGRRGAVSQDKRDDT
jgi:hypothetical protein